MPDRLRGGGHDHRNTQKLQRAGESTLATLPGRSPERLFVPVAVGDTPAPSGRCLLILTSGVRLEALVPWNVHDQDLAMNLVAQE